MNMHDIVIVSDSKKLLQIIQNLLQMILNAF